MSGIGGNDSGAGVSHGGSSSHVGGGGRTCTCGQWVLWGLIHTCSLYGGSIGGGFVSNLPTPEHRIADALERLVEIFEQGADTENRRRPRVPEGDLTPWPEEL